MDKCGHMIEELRRAGIRPEQNRYILDAISAKSDGVSLRDAKEKYGPVTSSTTSPGQKRKSRGYSHLQKTLEKVCQSGEGSSSSSSRVPSGSFLGAPPSTPLRTEPNLAFSSHHRRTPAVQNFEDMGARSSARDLHVTPSARISTFAEDLKSLDNYLTLRWMSA